MSRGCGRKQLEGAKQVECFDGYWRTLRYMLIEAFWASESSLLGSLIIVLEIFQFSEVDQFEL